jgi:His-Xaa-Ser system radical SAM maturase HxsC
MGAPMLTLSGKVIATTLGRTNAPNRRGIFSLSTNPNLPAPLRASKAFLHRHSASALPSGFAHYFLFEGTVGATPPAGHTLLGSEFSYLGDGDVVALGEGRLRSLYRADSDHNSLLLTERCNHYCLMCSQPPRRVDDDWILDEAFDAIRLIPQTAGSIGLTGGEPTLYGGRFIELVRHFKHRLPQTSLHILSNGRAFVDRSFTGEYAKVHHPDAMVGIPIYSSDPSRHDYVVQARGAFDETVRGVLHLKEFGQQVEIRVVLHKQTTGGLTDLARFIARNLLFVDHVALMGLEMTGFTRANLPALWIDPLEYRHQLAASVQILRRAGIRTSIYNLPLCLVDPSVESSYVKSISDWKNEFPPECQPCRRKADCGGFFSSALQHGYSKHIKPFD